MTQKDDKKKQGTVAGAVLVAGMAVGSTNCANIEAEASDELDLGSDTSTSSGTGETGIVPNDLPSPADVPAMARATVRLPFEAGTITEATMGNFSKEMLTYSGHESDPYLIDIETPLGVETRIEVSSTEGMVCKADLTNEFEQGVCEADLVGDGKVYKLHCYADN